MMRRLSFFSLHQGKSTFFNSISNINALTETGIKQISELLRCQSSKGVGEFGRQIG